VRSAIDPTSEESPAQRAGAPSDAEIRRQLERILASDGFQVSPRQRRFLDFVVTETLAGRAERIKAYGIAVEVFGRDESFDAQNDPIVRVEAGHLRRAMERYYLGAGRDDPVTITIPKGGYVPRFDWTEDPAPDQAAPRDVPVAPWRWRAPVTGLVALAALVLLATGVAVFRPFAAGDIPMRPDVPRLLVQPFEDLSQPDTPSALALGLTQEVIGQLAKFRDIVVLTRDQAGLPVPAGADAPRYILAGSVDSDDSTLRVQARVVSRPDGAVLWADSYSGDLTVARVLQIEREIAAQVATALGQPYGVIFQADTARQIAHPPEDWAAYACTLSYYEYRLSLEQTNHQRIRDCLERTVAEFPGYATAWALLAQVYIDELRFRFPPASGAAGPPYERALAAAERAVALEPTNIRGLQAKMFALFFAADMTAAVDVGRKALAINPNDTELLGEAGYRIALAGNWDEGCELVEAARSRSQGPFGYYETALALCDYIRGDLEGAATWIRTAKMQQNPQYHLIAAIIFAEKGDPAFAAEVDWLRRNAPHLVTDTRREVALRVGRAEDVDRFMASLAKAGLPERAD